MTDTRSVLPPSNRTLFAVAGLCILIATVYFRAYSFAFVNLDDNLYVYNNPVINGGLNWSTFTWAFTTFWAANWHPLTWLSHSLDVTLFGMNAGEHHLVNVAFHTVNSLLAFAVFRKMTGRFWPSLVVAALFAVHPAHVESVAWVAERKDVLSTMFWLLTMWAYVRAQRVSIAVVILFALGLMAKPMLVTLPFVLLLCDFWPFGRLRNIKDLPALILEKLPLLALSAAASVVTFVAQHSVGSVQSLDVLPLSIRFTNAIVSYAKYIVMMVYPADLAVWYPYEQDIPNWEISGSVLLLIGVTALCVWQFRQRPFLIFGWLWFLGTLVPVIGIVQVGGQSLADRYTYIPYFGLFVMIVWGADSLARDRGFGRYAYETAALVMIVAFTVVAHWQADHWQDNETLYRHALSVTADNFLVDHNLCHDLLTQNRLDEAEPLCRRAIELNTEYGEAYNTLGIILFDRGNFAEAEKSFNECLKYSPAYVFAWLNLSRSQARQARPIDAESSIQTAMQLNNGQADGSFADAFYDAAEAFAEQGSYDKAVEYYQSTLSLQPDNAEAHARLALSLYNMRRIDEAQAEVQNALSLKPDLAEAWNTLGLILLETNKRSEAADAFERALQLKPDYTEASENLARAKGNL